MHRFTLYGSPHSLPTYKVALMLRLCGAPFVFRYVSFQKNQHRAPEFLALSRWGQVPVLLDNGRVLLQSAAIVEHLAESLGRFQGVTPDDRQTVREWLFWDADVLFPAAFGCYGVELDRRGLLPLNIDPVIAAWRHRQAEMALATLDTRVTGGRWLLGDDPTVADLCCFGDVAFADLAGLDISRWPGVTAWSQRVRALDGFQEPFTLLQMRDMNA